MNLYARCGKFWSLAEIARCAPSSNFNHHNERLKITNAWHVRYQQLNSSAILKKIANNHLVCPLLQKPQAGNQAHKIA